MIASASSYVCAPFSRSSVSVIYSDCGENVAFTFRAKFLRAICRLNSSYSSLLLKRGRGSAFLRSLYDPARCKPPVHIRNPKNPAFRSHFLPPALTKRLHKCYNINVLNGSCEAYNVQRLPTLGVIFLSVFIFRLPPAFPLCTDRGGVPV